MTPRAYYLRAVVRILFSCLLMGSSKGINRIRDGIFWKGKNMTCVFSSQVFSQSLTQVFVFSVDYLHDFCQTMTESNH